MLSLSAKELVVAYHERTKHHYHRFAASVGYMDWATQPDPFRRYEGASLVRLLSPRWGKHFHTGSSTSPTAWSQPRFRLTPSRCSSATLLPHNLAQSLRLRNRAGLLLVQACASRWRQRRGVKPDDLPVASIAPAEGVLLKQDVAELMVRADQVRVKFEVALIVGDRSSSLRLRFCRERIRQIQVRTAIPSSEHGRTIERAPSRQMAFRATS